MKKVVLNRKLPEKKQQKLKDGSLKKWKNIIDLEDLSDLPEEVRKHLKFLNRAPFHPGWEEKILDLFKHSRTLSLNAITVGLYRLHNLSVDRRRLHSYVHQLCCKKDSKIVRISIGAYQLKNH